MMGGCRRGGTFRHRQISLKHVWKSSCSLTLIFRQIVPAIIQYIWDCFRIVKSGFPLMNCANFSPISACLVIFSFSSTKSTSSKVSAKGIPCVSSWSSDAGIKRNFAAMNARFGIFEHFRTLFFEIASFASKIWISILTSWHSSSDKKQPLTVSPNGWVRDYRIHFIPWLNAAKSLD